ncbi:hypothetical protein K3727_14380 [Rhodobacteraceae bacterium M382]|nr:hypothetical protein K3727_14380 [Rhodobacteraceae bacterium M382]
MEGYVGRSVTEPMLDYGRPASVFDLPDGARAFQWQIDSSGVVPVSTPSTTYISGSSGWATATTTSTSYVPFSSSCNYTLIAKPKGDDWVVVGYRKPTLMCE